VRSPSKIALIGEGASDRMTASPLLVSEQKSSHVMV
jgi:hypothetical protein